MFFVFISTILIGALAHEKSQECSTEKCNFDCYLARHKKVALEKGWNNHHEAEMHFKTHGCEDCTCQCEMPKNCDWQCYLNNYNDLQQQFGKSGDKALHMARDHFVHTGCAAGRNCACTETPKPPPQTQVVSVGRNLLQAAGKCLLVGRFQEKSGLYKPVGGLTRNGQPIWKHSSRNWYLYSPNVFGATGIFIISQFNTDSWNWINQRIAQCEGNSKKPTPASKFCKWCVDRVNPVDGIKRCKNRNIVVRRWKCNNPNYPTPRPTRKPTKAPTASPAQLANAKCLKIKWGLYGADKGSKWNIEAHNLNGAWKKINDKVWKHKKFYITYTECNNDFQWKLARGTDPCYSDPLLAYGELSKKNGKLHETAGRVNGKARWKIYGADKNGRPGLVPVRIIFDVSNKCGSGYEQPTCKEDVTLQLDGDSYLFELDQERSGTICVYTFEGEEITHFVFRDLEAEQWNLAVDAPNLEFTIASCMEDELDYCEKWIPQTQYVDNATLADWEDRSVFVEAAKEFTMDLSVLGSSAEQDEESMETESSGLSGGVIAVIVCIGVLCCVAAVVGAFWYSRKPSKEVSFEKQVDEIDAEVFEIERETELDAVNGETTTAMR